ncbi:MAG: anti-sigma factor antagonist [Streptosporangiales bacterium]|nr:anti-sigma factor antagonist [Streptosporangiales bacterium]
MPATERNHVITGTTCRGHVQPHPEVRLAVLRRPEYTIVRLRGELDMATAPALRNRLMALLHPGLRRIVLDLSGLTFCDATGLGLLVGIQNRTVSLGVDLRLSAPRWQLAKVLNSTGLDRGLKVHPTLTQALGGPDKRRLTARGGPRARAGR